MVAGYELCMRASVRTSVETLVRLVFDFKKGPGISNAIANNSRKSSAKE